VLEVADCGPGIPRADRENVLDRFVRLERSRSTPGNGLGLSLVRAVAKLHDGTIWLEDSVPGTENPGLKVIVELPLVAGSATSEADRDLTRLLPGPSPALAVTADPPRDLGEA
jgi:signal transduction histidine kinase